MKKLILPLLVIFSLTLIGCSDGPNPLDAKIKAYLTAQERNFGLMCNGWGDGDASNVFTFLDDGTLTTEYSTVHYDGNDNNTTYISERPGTYTIENGVVTINLDNRTNCTVNGTPYTCAAGTENYSGTATTVHSNELIISLENDSTFCSDGRTATLVFY